MSVTLSVVIANYNHGAFLKETLGAFAVQTRLADEIIVVDDCSTDDSLKILSNLQKTIHNLKVITKAHNGGAVAAYRAGAEAATGTYVYFGGADDRVRPSMVETALAAFQEFPHAGLCFSQGGFFGDTPWEWGGSDLGPTACFLSPEVFADRAAHSMFEMPTWCMVFRRQFFLENGGHQVQFGWNCDWFIAYVVGLRAGVCYVPEILADYRVVSGSLGANSVTDPSRQIRFMSKIMDELAKSDYNDIRHNVHKSGFLGHFPYALRTIMLHPRHGCFLSWALLKNNLINEFRLFGGRFLPLSMRMKIKRFLAVCRI